MSFLFRIATFNPTRIWNLSCPVLFLLDLLSFQEIYPEVHRLRHESTCLAGSISRRD